MDYISRITAKYYSDKMNKYVDFIVPDRELEKNIDFKINVGKFTVFSMSGKKHSANKTLDKQFINVVVDNLNYIKIAVNECYIEFSEHHFRYNPYIFMQQPKFSAYYEGRIVNTINVLDTNFNEKRNEFQKKIDDIVSGKMIYVVDWVRNNLKRKMQLE